MMIRPTTTSLKPETPPKKKRPQHHSPPSLPQHHQQQQQQDFKSIISSNESSMMMMTTTKKKEKMIVDIPAIVVPTNHLNIKCSRHYFCNTTNCQPLRLDVDVDIDVVSSSNFYNTNTTHTTNNYSYNNYSSSYAYSYEKIQNDFFNISVTSSDNSKKKASPSSSSYLKIQYWGDSLQATLDCDMRQWIYENSIKQPQQQPSLSSSILIQSEYVQVGCPWYCDVKDKNKKKKKSLKEETTVGGRQQTRPHRRLLGMNFLKAYSKQADVIVFNIGGHYENSITNTGGGPQIFNYDIEERYYDILQGFLKLPNRLLIIRSPSPTHFNTIDGLFYNETQYEDLKSKIYHNKQSNNNMEYGCTELSKQNIPTVIKQQITGLQKLTQRLKKQSSSSSLSTISKSNVEYLDIYELSLPRYREHAHNSYNNNRVRGSGSRNGSNNLDCKHYCQNCGLLRSWNIHVALKILQNY